MGCRPQPGRVWNRIPEDVRDRVVKLALDEPTLSPRELAVRFTDTERYFVSEASVYRLLKAHDLISSPSFIVVKAADEFKDKTTAPNQLWQTDFTYLKVIGWGWFYLSTVLDDFSRYIVAWKLCTTMKAEDVTETLSMALQRPYGKDWTCARRLPAEELESLILASLRTLVTDHRQLGGIIGIEGRGANTVMQAMDRATEFGGSLSVPLDTQALEKLRSVVARIDIEPGQLRLTLSPIGLSRCLGLDDGSHMNDGGAPPQPASASPAIHSSSRTHENIPSDRFSSPRIANHSMAAKPTESPKLKTVESLSATC